MTKHLRATSSWLACGLLLSACKIGYDPIGGEELSETGDGDSGDGDGDGDSGDGDGDSGDGDGDGDSGDGDGDGDGDSGDGDGDGDSGDGDGDGDGDCPPPPGSVVEVEFDYTLTMDPIAVGMPYDAECTIAALSSGTNASLGLLCGGTDVQIDFTVSPGLDLFGEVGDPAHLWLHHEGDEFNPTWVRVDFPEHDGNLFIIDAETFMPPDAYFPAPWGLTVVDDCGPIEDGCATERPEQLQVSLLGQTLELWQDDFGSLELSQASLQMWVQRAVEIVELSPRCDPTPDFFNTHQVLISSTGLPTEGDTCQPGESNPCGTGLHCCYPCGIPDCDFVCTPEDPDTMECPLPPP